jgi:hypothetical protein
LRSLRLSPPLRITARIHFHAAARARATRNRLPYERTWLPTLVADAYGVRVDQPQPSPEEIADGAPGRGPDIFTALEKQLGLKLEKGTRPVDFLVIDQADKVPTEN